MRIEIYTPERQLEWDSFIDQAKIKNGLFMFKRGFMDYHSDRFKDASLMFYKDNHLVAVLPSNRDGNTLYSHQGLTFGGVVSNAAMKMPVMLEVFSALKDFLMSQGVDKLVYKAIPYIYHAIPAQEDVYALFYNGARLFRVDVTTAVELTQKVEFSTLRKRGAKKALKAGVQVTQSHEIASYLDLLNSVLKKQHNTQAVHTVAELELLMERFPDNIKLYIAEKDGRMLSGVLIFEYERMVHAQYIASSDEGKENGALDLLFSTLIQDICKDKQFFDFGISTEDQGKVLNNGLVSQKEGFGGRAVVHQFYELDIAQ